MVVVVGAEMAGSGGRAVLVPPAAGPGIIFFLVIVKMFVMIMLGAR
jgi:hypothetical protein